MTVPPASPLHALPAYGRVVVDVHDGVATVRFGHPKGNSLPAALLRDLAERVADAGRQRDVRVIVLRSDGPGPFCAGASFDELTAIADADAGKEFFLGFARVILAMLRCPQFVVAAVHGKVAGGGVGLVAASDYSVAVTTAACKLSELAVGIGPFVVGPVIERKIGLAAFQGMAVDADWRDARWAHTHGLYTQLAETPMELEERVQVLAARLAASNPEAMALIKRAAWSGTDDWDELLARRAEMSGRLVLSDFTRNAIAKFKNR
ncbi:Enoyl-CoA hydratase/isomerase [Gemmatirosa kalamazoonensis]|uniref:Enoyl-CoA hydratase/isomerase n=1 Tax=Gemmatirosa kalamazoonensis TaxID=861299 RepID=W0RKH6_9BACT|nr:enoyl-CoA hydratase/isomerase family protein [Gemmatirosa kalamazoonensis]AHG91256.1 Enoyl-CoA hydratase/isomerase [Gemmatirosa kalamazoonensis]